MLDWWPGLVIAVTLLAAPEAGAACVLTPRASVPVTAASPLITVPVTVNGATLNFILGTGSERTVIEEHAAERVHLARDPWASAKAVGVGGSDQRPLGRPEQLVMGGLQLRRPSLAADNTLVVGTIAQELAGVPIAGLLGRDFLSPYDLDIDPAAHVLRLYSAVGCQGRYAPWDGPYDEFKLGRPFRDLLTVPLEVGVQPFTALVDTGSGRTALFGSAAERLESPGGQGATIRGFGANTQPARVQRFASVQVAGRPGQPMELLLSPLHLSPAFDALLGMDWLGGRRLWISWTTSQMFLAPR